MWRNAHFTAEQPGQIHPMSTPPVEPHIVVKAAGHYGWLVVLQVMFYRCTADVGSRVRSRDTSGTPRLINGFIN